MVKHAALRAWTAAAVPPLVWYLLQQGWGQMVRQACPVARPGGLTGAFVAGTLLALAALVAWPVRRAKDTSRFVAVLALGETVFFGLAILFQIIAGFLVPPCWR